MSQPELIPFAQLRGHERERAFLQNAISSDRLAHALLFAGSEGIGKFNVALALTAWLDCEQRPSETEFCGKCASCRQITAGTHPDVLVVRLASGKKEISVERARDLKRFTQLRAVRAPMKVAIIDDAHLLSVAAQNALLKTLEEPPNRSLIILVTSVPEALLPTIRSRCQRIQFAPLDTAVLRELLSERGIAASDAAQLAALAEGSLQRALRLRDAALDPQREAFEELLAGVGGARYSALMQLAEMLAQPESQLAVKLELLLEHYRSAAAHSLDHAPQRCVALRRATAVLEAAQALRQSNPNRQLLIDSLLLRLASA